MALVPVSMSVYQGGALKPATISSIVAGAPVSVSVYVYKEGVDAAIYPGTATYPSSSLYPGGVT